MTITSFMSANTFYDAVNFPRGFARSGLFTKREAEILADCGFIITQLGQGKLTAQTEDHEAMLRVIRGEAEATTEIEKTWMKYHSAISIKVPKFSAFAGRETFADFSEMQG